MLMIIPVGYLVGETHGVGFFVGLAQVGGLGFVISCTLTLCLLSGPRLKQLYISDYDKYVLSHSTFSTMFAPQNSTLDISEYLSVWRALSQLRMIEI